MTKLKLYLFNSTREWDTETACGLVAESLDAALALFAKNQVTMEDYEVDEIEIENGLLIVPSGFDSVGISASRLE